MDSLSFTTEKRLLQGTVFLLAIIPILAGGAGILLGPDIYLNNLAYTRSFDSHFHYLSGLLFAVGMGYWVCVPHIELKHGAITILTLIVFIGGLSRMSIIPIDGFPGWGMSLALLLEVVITPLLWVWQTHLAHRYLSEIKKETHTHESN
jgi:hypothetical protein